AAVPHPLRHHEGPARGLPGVDGGGGPRMVAPPPHAQPGVRAEGGVLRGAPTRGDPRDPPPARTAHSL
ncbi:MAG: hypothetical protein AVDCRST_MAG20-2790, partial [uncultured Acidimicrobiales bacterium]